MPRAVLEEDAEQLPQQLPVVPGVRQRRDLVDRRACLNLPARRARGLPGEASQDGD